MEESDDGSVRFPALGCRSRSSSSVGHVADMDDINDMLPMLSDDDADHSVPLGEKHHGSSSSVGNVADLEDINDMLPMLSDDDADQSVPLEEKEHGDILLPYEEII